MRLLVTWLGLALATTLLGGCDLDGHTTRAYFKGVDGLE